MNERVILTGANGFIGQNLSKTLKKLGFEVIPFPREAFAQDRVLKFFERTSFDYLINLAAYGNHSDQKDPAETVRANILNTFNLFEATRHSFYKGFINIGSSSEYGIKDDPMSESMVLSPTTMYGATKAAGTLLGQAYYHTYNKPIVTVRPFSIYGAGERENRFIPTVIRSLVKKESMWADMEPVHDWTHIDDFVSGVIHVMDRVKDLSGRVVNIGTGFEYSNEKVIQTLERIHGSSLIYNVFEQDPRTYDHIHWSADNALLRSLNWSPRVSLYYGLKRTYNYYRRLYEK